MKKTEMSKSLPTRWSTGSLKIVLKIFPLFFWLIKSELEHPLIIYIIQKKKEKKNIKQQMTLKERDGTQPSSDSPWYEYNFFLRMVTTFPEMKSRV